jgi:integrase
VPTLLRDHFERYVLLCHLGEADPSTIAEMRTSIRYWEEGTDNSPIENYRQAFPRFLEYLKAKVSKRGGPLAPATKRKHVSTIQFMLDRAGPETRDCGGAALIERPIKLPVPQGGASINKRPLTLREISRLLLACQWAEWERKRLKVSACAFWRCFILFAFNTGLRIESLMKLKWEWFVRDDSGHCCVSPAAAAAIEPMRVLESPLVFPFPFTYNRARSKFVQLMQWANIPQRGMTANKFHALRRSCNDELVKLNPYAAKLQLGHSTRDVTLQHYTSSAVLIKAHTELQQPPWTADVLTPPAQWRSPDVQCQTAATEGSLRVIRA